MGSQDSEQKIESSQLENGTVARPGFAAKAKRHCARWWWVHLLVFCVVFLLIALLLVYVGMPKIAQHDVNRSSLTFNELDFLNPTPNTITLTQLGVLHNPSLFTPTLDAFNATLSLVTGGVIANTSFFNIEIPKIHATKGDTDVPIREQLITVTDMDQLTQYCIAVLQNENVTTHLRGRTKLHLGALPDVKVNYRESTTYKALNGLQGFNVTDARIDLSVTSGPNFRGNAFIPNPSVMTIAMGNVTLSLATEAAGIIGNATIDNMTLVPGDNILPMQAVINQTRVLGSLNAATGEVDMKITGTSAVYNGQNLPYYEEALKSNVLSLTLNVAQILRDSAAAAAAA